MVSWSDGAEKEWPRGPVLFLAGVVGGDGGGWGKRSKWVVRGGRLPCHPKEPADLEVGGR